MHWPARIAAGVVIRDQLAASPDVMPTLSGLLGLSPPALTGPPSRFDNIADGVDLSHLLLRPAEAAARVKAGGRLDEFTERDGVHDADQVRITSGGVAYVGVISKRWWLTVESPQRTRANAAYQSRVQSFPCLALTFNSSGGGGGGGGGSGGGGRVGSSIGTSPQPAASCRLWDRATDAAQTVNVFGEHPAVVHSLIAALHRHVLRMSDALAENVDGKSGAAGGAPRCRDGAVVDCTQAARAVQYSLGFIFAPESLMCHSWYRSLVSATLEALEAPHDAEKPAVEPSPSSPLLCPLRWRNSWGAATSEEQAKRALKRSATSAHFKSSNRASKLAFARLSGRWLNTANLGDMDALMERLGVGSLKRKALAARNWGVGKIGQVIHVECACSLQANRTRVLILATRLSKSSTAHATLAPQRRLSRCLDAVRMLAQMTRSTFQPWAPMRHQCG